MIGVLAYTAVVALFSFGWSNLFNEGMVFERVGKLGEAWLAEWVRKPLYECPICVSVHATWVMALAGIVPTNPWWQIPLIALSASGLCSVLIGFQNKLKDIADVIEDDRL